MKKFWDWFDNLQEVNPLLRFAVFMVFATILLVIVPIVGFVAFDLSLHVGQVIGVTGLALVVFLKVTR